MADLSGVIQALNHTFLCSHPHDAARALEAMEAEDAAEILSNQAPANMTSVWTFLPPALAERILLELELPWSTQLMTHLEVDVAASLLGRFGLEQRQQWLDLLNPSLQRDINELLAYPVDTAGHLMDTHVYSFDSKTSVANALKQIKKHKTELLRHLYIVNEQQELTGTIDIRRLVLADNEQQLVELAKPIIAEVNGLAPYDEVVEQLQNHRLSNLPVVDANRRIIGVIYGADMIEALKEEIASDMATMVGASADERALSSSWFAVKKRMPWLQINLLTAFLAAAVVGMFESTIARYTALAILLPVAAGQSGNAGAQALAVTMRGLTLREIGMRHWLRVSIKEASTGLLNGLATALTCSAGVYIWSKNVGLALIMALAMVTSMTIAGVAGALVPIVLKRLGQDPAQSSSIILTTVTDIAGFMSFLGIATLLSSMLS